MAKKGKTHKATAKRFKKTATGKLLHKRQGDNDHLMAHKSQKARNRKKKTGCIKAKGQAKNIKKLLPS